MPEGPYRSDGSMKFGTQLAEAWQRNAGHIREFTGSFGEFFSRNLSHAREMFKGSGARWGGGGKPPGGQGRWQ